MFNSYQELEQQLEGDEGLRLQVYPDSRGYTTIGYGHKWLSGDPLTCTKQWALNTLRSDINIAVSAVSQNLPWADQLDDVRFGALANMAFNMGIDGLLEFDTFLPLMQSGQWAAAAADLQTTEWAQQVGQRAIRIRTQIVLGVWQYATP